MFTDGVTYDKNKDLMANIGYVDFSKICFFYSDNDKVIPYSINKKLYQNVRKTCLKCIVTSKLKGRQLQVNEHSKLLDMILRDFVHKVFELRSKNTSILLFQ